MLKLLMAQYKLLLTQIEVAIPVVTMLSTEIEIAFEDLHPFMSKLSALSDVMYKSVMCC